MGNNNSNPTVSSHRTTIIWGAILSIFTALIAVVFVSDYISFLKKENRIVSVSFKADSIIHLKSYPEWFFYDANSDSLHLNKVINEDEKEELLNLVSENDARYNSYKNAIDELAYKASLPGRFSFSVLLILCGIASVLGVQARTLWAFIGRICYLKGVDLKIWWPWYVLRPIIGFIIGMIIFIVWDLDILNIDNADGGNVNYLLFVGFLAGFAIQDVVELLRRLSKKIFSSVEDQQAGQNDDDKKNDDK